MAVTIAVRKRAVRGNEQVIYADITGPASYTTNGEALSAADLVKLVGKPGALIGDIVLFSAEDSTAGHALSLDRTNSKVKFFNGTTEIANATNLSAVSARVMVVSLSNG